MEITRVGKNHAKDSYRSRSLADEVAIITGASSGIGAATAWELAQRGAKVVLAARRIEELKIQANKITNAGYDALVVPTDVTDISQIRRLIASTIETFGKVDVLVNNAGAMWFKSLAEHSIEEITEFVNVNLLSTLLLTHAVLPGMLTRRHGAIISVASVAGHIPVDPLYSGTKFGLRGFSLSLRRQLAKSGVSVSVVSPGFIHTNMTEDYRCRIERYGLRMSEPELVAKVITNLVHNPRPEVIVPNLYRVLIGLEHIFPRIADPIISWGYSRLIGKN